MATLTLEEVQEETSDIDEQLTSAKKSSSRKRAPVVESEVRRSPRLKIMYNGSKPSICFDKKWLACSPSPPTLSSKLIRNLGTQFCEMNPELLEDAVLKKEKKSQPVSKKKVTGPKGQGISTEEKKDREGSDGKGEGMGEGKKPKGDC